MRPLCVFLCSDQLSYQIISEKTKDAGFHRYFILRNKSIVVDKNLLNNEDSLIYFDYTDKQYTLLSRMVVAYSNAIYSDFFIFPKDYYDIEQIAINDRYIWNDNFLYFSKNHVVFEGYDFNKEVSDNDNSYDFYENISKALSGEEVEEKYFIEAIKELLADVKYVFHESCFELEQKYKILFKSNDNSDIEYKIYYESDVDSKKAILFTTKQTDSYSYKITSKNGLICYFI